MSKRTRLAPISALVASLLLLAACGPEAATTVTPTAPAAPTAATPASSDASPTAMAAESPTAVMAESPTAMVAGSPTAMTGDSGEVRIGFAFVTSGDNAVYGTSQRAAAELAIQEINSSGSGPKITGIFEDTAAKPDQAITVFQKFINTDKVHAIIGPTLSNEAFSSDPEAQKAGVPVLAVSNTAAGITEIGDYIFRDSLAEFQVIPATISQAKETLGITKVSLMYANDDAFSKSGADVFRAELQKNNIQILSEQTFGTNDVDFRAQLTSVKGESPDAIVVSALAKPAQIILQQARNDVGIDPSVDIIGGNGFNSPAVVSAAGPAAEGLVVGAAWNLNAEDELSKKFITDFRQANGKDPDQFAAQSYAGVYIMYDAIKRASVGGKELAAARTAIRDALKSTSGVPTVLGPFSFTDARDANHPPVVQVVKDGKFDILGGSMTETGTMTPTP
jgi:branched-chain amino acid transport system substrate-binding protein